MSVPRHDHGSCLWVPRIVSHGLSWPDSRAGDPGVQRLAARVAHARALSSAVTLRFAYLAMLRMLGLLTLLTRSDLAKDAEILVLRHQIAVLQRHVKTPRPSWADRAIISALARLLPSKQRSHLRLIVSPRTLLRWHATIVKRRWRYPHRLWVPKTMSYDLTWPHSSGPRAVGSAFGCVSKLMLGHIHRP
jgi:hypothetical protein